MRSAILFRMTARSAAEVLPQAGAAACAASSASSMSSAVPRATSQNVSPVTGEGFSKYWPLTGGDPLAADEVVVAGLEGHHGAVRARAGVNSHGNNLSCNSWATNVSVVTQSRSERVAPQLHRRRGAAARQPSSKSRPARCPPACARLTGSTAALLCSTSPAIAVVSAFGQLQPAPQQPGPVRGLGQHGRAQRRRQLRSQPADRR